MLLRPRAVQRWRLLISSRTHNSRRLRWRTGDRVVFPSSIYWVPRAVAMKAARLKPYSSTAHSCATSQPTGNTELSERVLSTQAFLRNCRNSHLGIPRKSARSAQPGETHQPIFGDGNYDQLNSGRRSRGTSPSFVRNASESREI